MLLTILQFLLINSLFFLFINNQSLKWKAIATVVCFGIALLNLNVLKENSALIGKLLLFSFSIILFQGAAKIISFIGRNDEIATIAMTYFRKAVIYLVIFAFQVFVILNHLKV